MNKKPSLSIHSKQNSFLHENTAAHSLSTKKHYLTVVTPSQRAPKHIKTLKQIKKIAQGIKTTPALKDASDLITKKKVIPPEEIHSFVSEKNGWRKDLSIDVKPLQGTEKGYVKWSARTTATKMQGSGIQIPQTPINRLLLEQWAVGRDY